MFNENTHRIELSVIIPSYNRADTILKVLKALENQDYPKDHYQVIVVDDKSSDNTMGVLAHFASQTDMHFTYLEGKGESAGSARNLGLGLAEGAWILFLDADTIPNLDVVRRHVRAQKQFVQGAACIMGKVVMSDDLDAADQARLNETNLRTSLNELDGVPWQDYRTGNTSMCRSALEIIGGFDPRMKAAEDTELAYRAMRYGMQFYWDENSVAVHHHPMNLDGYLRKGESYGQSVAHWYQKSPELRTALISRYGVFAPEMSLLKKIKYVSRAICVNRLTVPALTYVGRTCRSTWFKVSDRLYRCVYRYRTRRAFRGAMTLEMD